MTTQLQSTMIEMCDVLFKTRAENFELLPSGGYGTWGFYTEYLGLHYYLIVTDTTESDTIYDTSNTENYEYNAVRTNYKIPELIMVPSECENPDDEINFEDITAANCQNSGDTWETDVNESLFTNLVGYHSYERLVEDKNFQHKLRLTKEQDKMCESLKFPANFCYCYGCDSDDDFLQLEILYNAPDLPSISREEFKIMVEKIFSTTPTTK
jgi:hypothetical protein